MSALHLLLLEDPADVHHGLRMRLGAERGMEVIAEASSVDVAAGGLEDAQPEVVLLDVRPLRVALDAVRRAHRLFPRAVVVLLAIEDSPALAKEAEAAGAYLLVPKHRVEDVLLPMLRQLADGVVGRSADESRPNQRQQYQEEDSP